MQRSNQFRVRCPRARRLCKALMTDWMLPWGRSGSRCLPTFLISYVQYRQPILSTEHVVLDVLHSMGYGTNRSDLQRVGGGGDGGIDGIISLDRLGLEKVYVQAKRWQGIVGRPEIQAFFGALAGQRASKGVFITTSTFSAQASQYAASVERIVLVDGPKLAELMIDHGVGVSVRQIRIPKIDSDYFDEGST